MLGGLPKGTRKSPKQNLDCLLLKQQPVFIEKTEICDWSATKNRCFNTYDMSIARAINTYSKCILQSGSLLQEKYFTSYFLHQ